MIPRRAAAALAVASLLAAIALATGCSPRRSGSTPEAAPLPAAAVTSFTRVPSLDASGSSAGDALPNRVLGRYGGLVEGGSPSLSWRTAKGASSVSPHRWLAYRTSAGRVFWLAGENGTVALTGGKGDASGKGAAARLVDAARADRVLATYELR